MTVTWLAFALLAAFAAGFMARGEFDLWRRIRRRAEVIQFGPGRKL